MYAELKYLLSKGTRYSSPFAQSVKHQAMKAYEKVEISAFIFLISALYRSGLDLLIPYSYNSELQAIQRYR
jgi:hypothetical protein